jgi:UDP-N-acetylglucosamine 3-dehydrogenase
MSADLTFFENGTVATEWASLAAFRGVTEGNIIRLAIPKPEPLRTEHEAFRDAILGNPSDIVTLEAGLQTLRVAEAVLESAEGRSAVQLQESR